MDSLIWLLENARAISSLEIYGSTSNTKITSVKHNYSFEISQENILAILLLGKIKHKFQSNSVHLWEKTYES